MLDIALSYVAEGWAVVPIAFREKRPSLSDGQMLSGWETLRIGADDAPRYFNGAPQNIGVILGPASHGLTDIDLDCDEAVRAASYLLPKTRCFGRASKRASHWLYYTDLADAVGKATRQWKEGPKPLLECRVGATGAQTVFPGSTHKETGEAIDWEDNNPIVKVDGADLIQRCTRLGAVSMLARHYPAQGGRHEAGLVIGGFLAGCGFTQGEGKLFASAVCAASLQPPDKARDIIRAVSDTIADAAAGRRGLFGWPKLKETFGDEAAKKCADWLGFKRDAGEDRGGGWPADQPPEGWQDSARDGRSEPAGPPAKPVRATRFVYRNPALIPPREFLYGKHSIRGFMSATASSGGIGKTTLILSESLSIATGRSLLGVPVHERSAVWYIGLEDPIEEYERRMAAIILRHSIDGEEELNGMFFLDSGRDQNFVVATEARAGVTIVRPVVDSLIAEIRSNKISKLIVDPFVAAHKVSENDNAKIGEVARVFSEIAHATDCSVELIHHFRKAAPGVEATADDMRGAKALADHARSVRVLSTMSAAEAERMDILDAKRLQYFKVVYGKENLSVRSDKAEWVHLESISLGNAGPDKRGIARDDDRIGVAVPWKPPTAWDEIGVEDLRAAQAAVSKGRWRADVQAKDWAGVAIAEALGLDVGVKSDKAKISEYLKVWIDNGQFSRVQEMDEGRRRRWFIRVGGHVQEAVAVDELDDEGLPF